MELRSAGSEVWDHSRKGDVGLRTVVHRWAVCGRGPARWASGCAWQFTVGRDAGRGLHPGASDELYAVQSAAA